jgi:hypothetical protein
LGIQTISVHALDANKSPEKQDITGESLNSVIEVISYGLYGSSQANPMRCGEVRAMLEVKMM